VCVYFFSLLQTNHSTLPLPFPTSLQIVTRARHEPSHRKPCQPPNLPLPFYLPSLTTHAPTWCPGNWPSTGQGAAYSSNGTPSGSCSPSTTTLSGLSSTPPGELLRARPNFPEPAAPALTLLPATLSNAPRTAGQRCWHVQPLSCWRSWIALAKQIVLLSLIPSQTPSI
jgi:hypothetical protein